MDYCSNCGKEIETPATFCPFCGTPAVIKSTTTQFISSPSPTIPPSLTITNLPPPPPTIPPPPKIAVPKLRDSTLKSKGRITGLFSPQRTSYIINENSWDLGSGVILDEHGHKIGIMTRKILSLRAEISLKEANGIEAAKIHRKLVALKPTYDITDASDKLIGRIEKALISLRPKLAVLDQNGNKLLEIKGNFTAWDFTIKDTFGNLVGTVSKLDRLQDIIFSGIWDQSDKYALQVEGDVDRRLVVATVIAIDNMFHDE